MEILQSKYKRILGKLDLSIDQLSELKAKLRPQNICNGPFINGEKMCPNTMALSLKLNRKLEDRENIRKLLNQYGVTNSELIGFYLLFDLPAMISSRFFKKSLNDLTIVVEELMNEEK